MRAVVMALAFALAGVGAAGCECGKIRQRVFIAPPDDTLAPLIESCRTGTPGAGEDCRPSRSGAPPTIACGCAALCRRVLALIDDFSGDESLLECRMVLREGASGSGGTGGGGGRGGSLDAGSVDAGSDGGAAGGATGRDGGTSTGPARSWPGTVEVDVTYRPSTCH